MTFSPSSFTFPLAAQRLVEAGMIEEDVFHPALHGGRIECLCAHQSVRVQRVTLTHEGAKLEQLSAPPTSH
jgi:hypothetical protein